MSKATYIGVTTWLIALVSLSLISLTACPTHAAQNDIPLHLGNAGEPQTLDPHRYNLRLEETLLNDLFLGLTTFNAKGEIIPGAAHRWESSEDGLTWTFFLREDLKWSDGTNLNAEDFVYSFRRLQDPKTAASLAYFLHMIKNAKQVNAGELPIESLGVSNPDLFTFVIQLDKPYPFLLERLLYPTAFPVPAHIIKRHAEQWTKPQHWVSNGAYTLKDWQPQAHIKMSANPHYFAKPAIREVHYFPVASEQNAYNRFRNNELHAISSFPVDQLDSVQNRSPEALRMSPLLSMMYLVFNVTEPPFDDLRVRQALSLAINQDILTNQVLNNGYTKAHSFAPSLIEGYLPSPLPHASTPYGENLQLARKRLQQAGYNKGNPLQITLRHVSTFEGKKVNLAVSGMWQQIGVKTKLQQADLRTHFADLRSGDFQVAWAGWVGENNAEHYLTLLQSEIGGVNYGRFNLPAYDLQLKQVSNTADLASRNKLLSQAEAMVVNHYPVIPLYHITTRRLVTPKLNGWHNNLRDIHPSRYLSW